MHIPDAVWLPPQLNNDTVRDWFERDGWRCTQGPPELRFITHLEMPEGFWRVARVVIFAGRGGLALYFRDSAGNLRRLHHAPRMTFLSLSELELLVASSGPVSFRHVIEEMRAARA